MLRRLYFPSLCGSSSQCRLFFLRCCGFRGRSIPNTDFLGTQSEFPRLHITAVTNDEVQEYHTELFAFDPIWRIGEWRLAMLADPNHTRKFSKRDAIPIASQFLPRGEVL
jgi:hypothetical protein